MTDDAQQALLAAVLDARATGEALVLADPGWSAPVRERARRDVESACAAGRVGPGTIVTFSSGSTGVPKGIVRTHASWEDSLPVVTERTGIGAGDVVGLPGSLGASLYSFGAWHAASVGAGVLLSPAPTDDVTALHCVPTRLRVVLAERARGGWSALRVAVVAGEPLTPAGRDLAAGLGIRVVEYYGAAELSLVALRSAEGLAPAPGVECQVRDGILWSRSPYAMTSYLDGSPGRVDADGWRSVGDLVSGSASAFEVLGRGDLAVSVGGHTIAVEEVERGLRAIPEVVDAVAVGLPHARLGQSLAAVVEGDVTPDAVRALVRDWPAPSRPRRVVVGPLPRLPGGKPDRRACLELLGGAS